jgi:chorismate-pyruvate lyase
MSVVDQLAELHFTAQHEAAADLDRVDIVDLDPFLRGLLFTDGTVSRALEAHTLNPVAVEAVEQVDTTVPERVARHLDVDPAEQCLRRRIVMRLADASPSVWAESFILPRRLPAEFLAVLDGSAQGIGGSLQRMKLESWRDLLWFGLGRSPRWSDDAASATALARFYRVIIDGAPALLISEAFAVELRLGRYRLIGPPDVVVDRTRTSASSNASS